MLNPLMLLHYILSMFIATEWLVPQSFVFTFANKISIMCAALMTDTDLGIQTSAKCEIQSMH